MAELGRNNNNNNNNNNNKSLAMKLKIYLQAQISKNEHLVVVLDSFFGQECVAEQP